MFKVDWIYWVTGAFFLVVAGVRVVDREAPRRYESAAFWAILSFAFVYGTFVVKKEVPAFWEGIAVLGLVVLAGVGIPKRGTETTTSPAQRTKLAEKYGVKLFIPALVIPVVAVIFGSALKKVSINGNHLLESGDETIIGLGVGAVVALVVALILFRERSPVTAFREGDRLLGQIGWAVVLPQFLATLGALFAASGVGNAVHRITNHVLPHNMLFPAILVYCIGMAVFTIIMGNAFAAFPVMVAAVGWPVLVQQYHGEPAVVFALGMLAGFCGTLCTPMAANFNLVPAALLELKDQYGPIKAQIGTAVPLLACNILILYIWGF